MNRLTESEIIRRFERAVIRLGRRFQGDKAFYFFKEEDIRCRLYAELSGSLRDCDIIHAEQYMCVDRRYFDLVIWRPWLKEEARIALWNSDYTRSEENMPELILTAVEIVHLYSGTGRAGRYTSYSVCEHDDDIDKLIQGIKKKTVKHAYFLLFWDDNVMSSRRLVECAKKMSEVFQRLEKKHRIRSFCVSRDSASGPVFVWGFKGSGPSGSGN